MGFLVRIAFWFSLVLLLLPLGTGPNGENSVSPLQAIFAAREAVGDLAGICERKPDVCETGKAAMQTIGVRARESARIAYQALDQQFGEPDTATQTGSVPEAAVVPTVPEAAAVPTVPSTAAVPTPRPVAPAS
ncbi:DUF5330 domain-containing protein [Aminobacter anthyllidis]|uniref:DUF5330 domain-containing protein n=1 Tax=Aminobacter anthyllidis TaxID=1035067 RepID=A0A9X1A8I8_9HYPH|nr:DUF5330 domain-containing protein [Aminobacter anthyllidis]MBT1155316.1 DUF5330 domain-containing protein [Aminobacter anthyllidis]